MRRIDIPLGTVFGKLTTVEATRASGRLAMLCQCECGKTKVVTNNCLRSGDTKSCGRCWADEMEPVVVPLKRGEVPLGGRNALGRVALVDDEDYDLIMQYRWHVLDSPADRRRKRVPYAQTALPSPGGGKHGKLIRMHVMIMGQTHIDHKNGNGLDNRKSNLRPATNSQNRANADGWSASGFKGVYWKEHVGKYQAMIRVNKKGISLGYFVDPAEGARAYDAAAREAFGEFAKLNFYDEPTEATEARWEAEHDADAERRREIRSARMVEQWKTREPVKHTCTVCGREYESTSMRPTFYCSKPCRRKKYYQQERERLEEGRLF